MEMKMLFYHDGAVRSLRNPFSPNRRPRLLWRHYWKAVHCCDVIIEKPCIVGGITHGQLCKLDSITIATGIPRFYCYISLCRLKLHTSDNFLYIHNSCINIIHAFKPWWNAITLKFFFTWVLGVVVLCLPSSTILTSSHVHSDVLSEEGDVDLKLVIPISLRIILLQKLHDFLLRPKWSW